MRAELRERLFQPFAAGAAPRGGSGLGLAICRRDRAHAGRQHRAGQPRRRGRVAGLDADGAPAAGARIRPDERRRQGHAGTRMRLDKWLWAARFYKTRAWPPRRSPRAASQVNGQAAKASREVRVGDRSRCARARCRAPCMVAGAERRARPGAGGAGAVRGDGREHRRSARGCAEQRRARRRAGADHRTGPADQARPAPAGRLGALERHGRRRRAAAAS